MSYSVVTLADSIGPHKKRLWTAEITYPRFIHDEMLTHRHLSRNTSSSRAVPVEKVIQQVIDDPVIPLAFGRNTKGMSSTENLVGDAAEEALAAWKGAARSAVNAALDLKAQKVHKQFANRVLMPFTWITTIVSATEWENFFALRTDEAAQPEMRKIATMMLAEYHTHIPQFKDFGEWHTPLVSGDEYYEVGKSVALKLSVARCAAVSYLRQHDERTIEDWIKVHDKLLEAGHMSPFEHVAYCAETTVTNGNFKGWFQYRHIFNDVRSFSNEDARKVLFTPESQVLLSGGLV